MDLVSRAVAGQLARLMSEDASGVDMRNWSVVEFGVQLSLVTG